MIRFLVSSFLVVSTFTCFGCDQRTTAAQTLVSGAKSYMEQCNQNPGYGLVFFDTGTFRALSVEELVDLLDACTPHDIELFQRYADCLHTIDSADECVGQEYWCQYEICGGGDCISQQCRSDYDNRLLALSSSN